MLTTNLIRVAAASAVFSLVWPLTAANKFRIIRPARPRIAP